MKFDRFICLCLVLALLAACVAACGESPDGSAPPASQPGTTTPVSFATSDTCAGVGECSVHYLEYHNVDGNLIKYVGMDRMDAWLRAHRGGEFVIGEFTIVDFVQEMEIDKATFMACLGITEENWNGYLPNTAIPECIIAREYVEAIYSGDQATIEAVFLRKPQG